MISSFSHIGVSTHDMEATLNFYCNILKCKLVADENIQTSEKGSIRQSSISIGAEEYIVFMEAKGVDSISEIHDTSINGALGLPPGMYHYAFKVDSLAFLQKLKKEIEQHDIEVSEITDLDYIHSIFFQDPNGLQLEASVKIRDFNASDIGKNTNATVAPSS